MPHALNQKVAQIIGSNIGRVRRRIGLSQEALSHRAGLHRTAIGHLERGTRMPRVDTLMQVAGALEVETAELVSNVIWRPSPSSSGGFKVRAPVPGERGTR